MVLRKNANYTHISIAYYIIAQAKQSPQIIHTPTLSGNDDVLIARGCVNDPFFDFEYWSGDP